VGGTRKKSAWTLFVDDGRGTAKTYVPVGGQHLLNKTRGIFCLGCYHARLASLCWRRFGRHALWRLSLLTFSIALPKTRAAFLLFDVC